MLCYAGVLVDNGRGGRHQYTVQNSDILEYISRNDTFSLRFLQEYIEKVLSDSGIMPLFEDFFNNQDKAHFKALKDAYEDFIIANTKINGRTEVRRIYTKVLNPLAFKYNKKGTMHGSLSKQAISRSELMYNRDNFRDVYSGKPRGLSRRDWLVQNPQIDVREGYFLQMMNSAKRTLRNMNDEMRNSQSELTQFVEGFNDTERATQIHHIFPKNEFPEIMHYLENLIALTPNQHYGFAHPDNNTQVIDLQAQKMLLIAKTSSIQYNLLSPEEETIYSFENFKIVLHIGWDDETVLEIADNDFTDIVHAICYHYATA